MISPKEALWFPIGQVSYAQWPTTTAARHQPEQKTSKEGGGLFSPCTLHCLPVKHLPLVAAQAMFACLFYSHTDSQCLNFRTYL